VAAASRVSRLRERSAQAVTAARGRWPVVDHAWRTRQRYAEVLGGRLAAAIAYYGFFATFALTVVGYAVLGFLVEHRVDLRADVDEFLQENLPVLDITQVAGARGAAGVLGLVGLVLTGVAWVEALRSSQRLIWGMPQQPGSVWKRRLLDVATLAVLALLLGGSLVLAGGVERMLAVHPAVEVVVRWALAFGVNLLLAAALLVALPRIRVPARRMVPAGAAFAVGLLVLNTLGGFYIDGVRANPAYAVVAAAAGLLVYLYVFNQLLLWAASWAATATPSFPR
jgi:membrane protein